MSNEGDLDTGLRGLLARAAVPTLVSTLHRMGISNTLIRGVRPIARTEPRMVGTACTMRTIPMREDHREAIAAGRLANLQARAFETVRAGEVLVCAAEGVTETALLGDIITTSFLVRGVAGIVVDGSVSDRAAIATIGLPVYCAGDAALPFVSHRHVIELQVAVGCGGVPVFPGDVLVGDANGVVCIPRDKAAEVARIAADRETFEAFLVERIRAGAPLAGSYPPDAATTAAYEAWLKARADAPGGGG